jgi:regulator of RNase E activity RraA
MPSDPFTPELLQELSGLSTCVVASAIETFAARLRNIGFTQASIHSMFPEMPPVVGYAATARIRSSDPPMEGHRYYDHTEWWNDLLTIPAPRIVVIEDLDEPAGLGAFIGEVHAKILQRLGCAALVTNGGVRDLPAVQKMGFAMFAGNVSVSHAYAHVFDFGGPVSVAGLEVRRGDLVHADLHGAQTIPASIATKIPAAAQHILQNRKLLIDFCESPNFSLETLQQKVKKIES